MSMGIRRPGKFRRCVLAVIRALCSVRDLYVSGMIVCAGGQLVDVGTTGQQEAASLPMLTSSDADSTCGLVRSSSLPRARSAGIAKNIAASGTAVPRSRSVAIGRIDEDHCCDFNDDFKIDTGLLFPRSKSHAVWK